MTDIDVGNLLAIYSAFERQTPVTIRVDENNHIERVETNGRAPDPPIRDPGQTGSVVTRIATQQGDDTRVAEVFFLEDPSATPPVESQALTRDPFMGRDDRAGIRPRDAGHVTFGDPLTKRPSPNG